jgi:hypothetical protein
LKLIDSQIEHVPCYEQMEHSDQAEHSDQVEQETELPQKAKILNPMDWDLLTAAQQVHCEHSKLQSPEHSDQCCFEHSDHFAECLLPEHFERSHYRDHL